MIEVDLLTMSWKLDGHNLLETYYKYNATVKTGSLGTEDRMPTRTQN